ncbi:MAG: hypothetical protein CFE43_11005 [Burkholderiales bacterium PBB3]|nr:MAG: hypothetical protein CFE43_11005 [Burkholderiales bacterium PBB3]
MQRRFVLSRSLAVAMLSLALAGCGFHLRSNQEFTFKTIAINPTAGSPVAQDLARYFGAARVPLTTPSGGVPPEVVLHIVEEVRERNIVAVNASGQVRELQLLVRLKFKVQTPQGLELINTTEISQQRDISFNESSALAKEAEELLLYRDMQNDIVQQMLRRLAAIKLTPAP